MQTKYFIDKYPAIEVCRWNHKAGKIRKHAGILGAKNIVNSGHQSGFTHGGEFIIYYNKFQKVGDLYVL